MLSEILRRDTLSQAGRARAANAKPQTDAFWSLFGDAVFALLVLSSVAWGLASIGHYKGWWDIGSFLGEHYDRDGFCLAHKGTWYESQLLSMYGSVVLAFVLQVMVRRLAGNRGELLVVDCVEINQCVSRAVRNEHHHAIEHASRRWRERAVKFDFHTD